MCFTSSEQSLFHLKLYWSATMKILTPLYTLALFALSYMPAFAKDQDPSSVPEPGSFALLAIGAGAAAIVWARKRNKK
jgi:hypothetical protein